MNVLYIAHDASLYGATRSLIELVEEMKHFNVNPYVIIPYKGKLTRLLRIKKIPYSIISYSYCFRRICSANYISENLNEIKNIKAIYEIIKVIRNKNIDMIHSNNLGTDVGAIAALLTNKKHIWHIREFMEEDHKIEFVHKHRMKYLMDKASACVAISQAIYAKYSLLYRGKKMVSIYDGLQLHQYIIEKEDLFKKRDFYIIFCGYIQENKGQLEAIKAIHLLKKGGVKNICLHIFGDGESKYLSILERYIKENELYKEVKLEGFQENLINYRKLADIELVCSKFEALGRVTIEAMLAKNLVIGADTAATKELIGENGKNGLLYKQGDAKCLADTILYAILNQEKSIEVINRAYEYAIDNFSSEKSAKLIINLYHRVLAR